MLVFVTLYLWYARREFPDNWSVLVILYVALVPLAALYGWLTDARSVEGSDSPQPRVPKLLLIGIGAAIVICASMLFSQQIDTVFYSDKVAGK